MPSVQSVLDAHARAQAAPPLLDDEADDPNSPWEILADGRRVMRRDGVCRVPIALMDSLQREVSGHFRPERTLTDAEARADADQAREEAMIATANAWRTPPVLGDAYPPYRDPNALPGSWQNPPPPQRWGIPVQPPATIREEPWVAAMQSRQAEMRAINEQAFGSDPRAEAEAAYEAETARRASAWRTATW